MQRREWEAVKAGEQVDIGAQGRGSCVKGILRGFVVEGVDEQAGRWWLRVLCLLWMVSVLTGCRGCSDPTKQGQADKDKAENRKSRLTVRDVKVEPYPSDPMPMVLKPGHWYQGRQEIRANEENEALELTLMLGRKSEEIIPLSSGNQYVKFHRRTSIAKGQTKATELLFYVPSLPSSLEVDGQSMQPSLRMEVKNRGFGVTLAEQLTLGRVGRPEQYSVVVLSKDPARHQFWGGLSCMVWPSVLVDAAAKVSPHRVISLGEKEMGSSLPDRAVLWTPISHLVWYDADPSMLSESQQRAIVDWLHFGGQIIFSGPDALGAVNNSFLSPYFPLREIQTQTLTQEKFQSFVETWTVPNIKGERDVPLLAPTRQMPWLSVQLGEGAEWVPQAESLIAESAVGNGRVCVAMVPLSEDVLVRWKSYASLVNAALLRHPPRDWRSSDSVGGEMVWWKDLGREGDPTLSTRFRWLTRDSRQSMLAVASDEKEGDEKEEGEEKKTDRNDTENELARLQTRSAAGWNDESSVSTGAAMCLAKASGISVPRVDLIVKLLAGYLLILVPLNWLVFKLMGRVEWAWVAAPFIALIGGLVVARSVQLDIGFSRSENRVGCIEVVAGHARAHQTDYVALYTSLSTPYSALFPDDVGVVLPMMPRATGQGRVRRDRIDLDYQFASDERGGITRYPIRSNTTGVLHAEEMVDLGGAIDAKVAVDGEVVVELTNRSKCDLRDVWVCGYHPDGAWIEGACGDLRSGRDQKVRLQAGKASDRWPTVWKGNEVIDHKTEVKKSGDRINIGTMMEMALSAIESRPGKLVAIGWTEQTFGSLEITPSAVQQNRSMMVVVHLASGKDPLPLADKVLPDIQGDAELFPDQEIPEVEK